MLKIGDQVRMKHKHECLGTGEYYNNFEGYNKIGVVKEESVDSYYAVVEFYDEVNGWSVNKNCQTIYIDDLIPLKEEQVNFTVPEEDLRKPVRYNKRGKLECWDVILDQEMDFIEGSILKYLWRYKEKGGVKDLKKIIEYTEKQISILNSKG